MKINTILLVFMSIFVTGCAIGNTYDYSSSSVDLPIKGRGELGVAVLDARPYIVSGNKSPNFVGLQRGGFGNPFDVTTDSGNPLATDMATAIANELKTNGFEVVNLQIYSPDNSMVVRAIRDSSAPRSIVLTVSEWKTDAMMSFGLSYDLTLEVFDASAKSQAIANISGNKEKLGGAGMESTNSATAANAFSNKVERLFSNPDVKDALMRDFP